MNSVGLYEKALPQSLSWEERSIQANRAGFDFLEISIDDTDFRMARLDWGAAQRRAVRDAAERTGIPVRSLALSAHRRYPLGSRSEATRRKARNIFLKAIDLALSIGVRTVLVGGAEDYYEKRDQTSKDLFLAGLEEGFSRASEAGLMLALENWDIQIDSLTRVMRYVRHFNSPWFQAYADIGNLVYAGKNVLAELSAAQGHIAALHVKDTIPGQLRYVTPGEGHVDFQAAFAHLAFMGFQGPVVLEMWTEKCPDAFTQVRHGCRFIKQQMEAGRRRYEDMLFRDELWKGKGRKRQ